MEFEISIYVEVRDPILLAASALNQLVKDGLSVGEAEGHVYDDDGEPNIGNCLIAVADLGISWPGTSIHESQAARLR